MPFVNLLFAAACAGLAVYSLTLNLAAAVGLAAAVLNFGTALLPKT